MCERERKSETFVCLMKEMCNGKMLNSSSMIKLKTVLKKKIKDFKRFAVNIDMRIHVLSIVVRYASGL